MQLKAFIISEKHIFIAFLLCSTLKGFAYLLADGSEHYIFLICLWLPVFPAVSSPAESQRKSLQQKKHLGFYIGFFKEQHIHTELFSKYGHHRQLGKITEVHLLRDCQCFFSLGKLPVMSHFALAVFHFMFQRKVLIFQHSVDPCFKAG